jgi:hypothetical protein
MSPSSLSLSFLAAGCNRIAGCADVHTETGLMSYGSSATVIIMDTGDMPLKEIPIFFLLCSFH